MKKIAIVILSFVMLLSLAACQSKEDVYNNQVKDLTRIEMADLNKMIEEKKTFNLYLGRENCPYCQIIAPQLVDLVKKEKVEIFYLDTLNTNEEMDKFFKDYKLEYVPSLMVFTEGDGQEIKLNHNQAKTEGKYDMEEIKVKFR